MVARATPPQLETIAAESPKYTAPLLFVHGLWCTAACWRRVMGYLAHRGWTSHALQLPSRDGADLSLAALAQHVQCAMAACAAAPVVIGHDLGGRLALTTTGARAVVALAPLTNAAHVRLVTAGWRTRLQLLRAAPVPPPRGLLGRQLFAGPSPQPQIRESAQLLRALRRAPDVPPAVVPSLIVAGAHDRFCPPADAAALALRIGATLQVAPDAGHALPWEPDWERRAAKMHSWIVRTLGETLLALLDAPD